MRLRIQADFEFSLTLADRDQTPIPWSAGEFVAWQPPSDLTVSEWAEKFRRLQPGISRQPGQWSNATTPYLVDVMDTYNRSHVRHMVLCFGTQLGKTESLYCIIGYIVDQEPYSTLLVYPREDDAKGISRSRVQPMVDDCPSLREKKPPRQDLYQLLEMHFPGMILYLVGANSPAALAQKPCRNILRDEIDKYPDRVGKDADPLSLSEERSKSFWDIRKIVDVSSPTLEDVGIWKQLQACDVIRSYLVPCPHCNHRQKLSFDRIKWDPAPKEAEWTEKIRSARSTAHYQCEHCHGVIGDDAKAWMLQGGKWTDGAWKEGQWVEIETDSRPEKVGFHLSSLYSPWLTWADIAVKFLEAMQAKAETHSSEKLQNFINGWLAETWVERVEIKQESDILKLRCEYPPLVVPTDAIALTCGIDCQKTGFYFTVRAWGRDMTSWLIRYGYLLSWDDVRKLLCEDTYEVHGTDARMSIWRAAIDTGGGEGEGDRSMTEQAYSFIASIGGNCFGVKGSSREMASKMTLTVVGSMPGKKNIPIPGGGLRLWIVDTDLFKDTFYARMQIKSGDPGAIYLHSETDMDYAKQIVSEEKRRQKDGRYKWVQVRGDNHYLDTEVYNSCLVDPVCMGGLKLLSAPIGIRRENGQEQQAKRTIQTVKSRWMGGM